MSIRPHRLGALGAAAALLAGGLLSGCGVSDQQLRPGVAAQVGGTEVSLDEVDDAIDVACGFFVEQGQAGFPRSLARQQFVSILVQRAAASEALAEEGLALGAEYDQAVNGLDEANAEIPADSRAPFVLLSEAATFVDAAAAELGEAALSDEGEVAADPALAVERGRTLLAEWLQTNGAEINPVFRLTVDDEGQVVTETGGTSVAVTDLATSSLLDPLTSTQEQVTAAAAQLPPGQLCGGAA